MSQLGIGGQLRAPGQDGGGAGGVDGSQKPPGGGTGFKPDGVPAVGVTRDPRKGGGGLFRPAAEFEHIGFFQLGPAPEIAVRPGIGGDELELFQRAVIILGVDIELDQTLAGVDGPVPGAVGGEGLFQRGGFGCIGESVSRLSGGTAVHAPSDEGQRRDQGDGHTGDGRLFPVGGDEHFEAFGFGKERGRHFRIQLLGLFFVHDNGFLGDILFQ